VARGIEAWAHDLGHALAARGKNVLLCKGAGSPEADFVQVLPCWTRQSPAAQRWVQYMPRFLGWRLGLGNTYDIEQATFAWHLVKLLRRKRIDILHVQDPQVALLAQRAGWLGLVKTKTILAHGTEEPLEYLRRFTYLQHLAPWHFQEARAAGVWKPTWTAIGNFIDTERFHPGRAEELRKELDIPPDALVLLSAAAIKRNHKRVDHLVREVARLRQQRPELPVWLVVAGGLEKQTEEVIAEGKDMLGERVRFLVRFPRERMPELYRAADLFVLGSLKEMMPIALLEATASGLPCVINAHPVMQWMIGPGGRAIDMAAEGVLAAELEKLLSNAQERRELGRLARQHCEGTFSRDRVVDQILAYYDFVMHHDQKAPSKPAGAAHKAAAL
jgi:glycosyltransferase involved in cell wall biosynthesis